MVASSLSMSKESRQYEEVKLCHRAGSKRGKAGAYFFFLSNYFMPISPPVDIPFSDSSKFDA